MQIIKPIYISAITTNVADDIQPVWDVGTTYSAGNQVRYGRYIYKALASTTGEQPDITPTKWLRISAQNKWAMFSDQISDKTESADTIDVSFTPGSVVNAIAFFGVEANTVTVTVTDPVEGIVYNHVENLTDDSGVSDWWGYFFEPISIREDFVLLDLPAYGTADIGIGIDKTGDTAKCGLVKIGIKKILGLSLFGTSIGDIDYSRKERDAFGRPIIVERGFAKRASFDVVFDTDKANVVQKELRGLRTTPAVYIGDENREETIIFGYYKDFEIVLSNPTTSNASIEIEGLT